MTADTATTSGITRGRALANDLLKGGAAPAGVETELKDIELQLRRFGAKLENQKM